MKHIIGFVAMLLPIICGAQSPPVKPLTIGDTVPDIVFNHVINYKDTTVRLSDFKGKLVILDFWATWCGGCIQGFPKADSLQSLFENSIQIILVNPEVSGDSLHKILATFGHLEKLTGKKNSLPVAMYDEIAFASFPFHTLPNLVWIDKNYIVQAISGKEHLTEENIKNILNGINPHIPLKKDTQFN